MRHLPSIPMGILAAGILASPAAAHTGVGATAGMVHGFVHPVGGLDHVLAMVAVGLFAYLLGGRALWLVPAAFVAMMAVGGGLGMAGVAVPFVEIGIALSVVVIGGMVAFGRSLPVALAMAVVGGFAVFHGLAHGAEMPATASGLAYGAGFVTATALLHGGGLLAAFGLARLSGTHGGRLARAGGGAMAVAGVALLGGVL